MDEETAAREVAANLRSVARLLHAYTTPELSEAANRLEQIARRVEALRFEKCDEKKSDRPGIDLVSDTLLMLESFRQIDSPTVRRAAISMIRALRPDA